MFHRSEESDYSYAAKDGNCHASPEMITDFQENGFVIARNVFSEEEVTKLSTCIVESEDFWGSEFKVKDHDGKTFDQSQWSEVGTDVVGAAAKTEKVARVATELLGKGEIYLYSGKVIMKPPKTGGGLIWHQDYGYWYNNGCLWPDFVMAFIALTKNDRENGGLEVLRGSQKCGRINHFRQAGQTGADLERVHQIQKICPLVQVDLGPGDAIFFHSNLLHRSQANHSEFKRWNLIFSFNAVSNCPPADSKDYNNSYTDATKVEFAPQDAVLKCTELKMQKRSYLDPSTNHNISVAED